MRALIALAAAMVLLASPSVKADEIGILGNKLVILYRSAIGNAKTKVVYLSKSDPGIHKGASGDPALLSGTFEWFYTDAPLAVFGSFAQPSSPLWVENSDALAKWSNPPGLAPTTKLVAIRPGVLAKFAAQGIAEMGAGDFATQSAPSDSGGVTTVLTINNGNDSSTHRMCTQFAVDLGSSVIFKNLDNALGPGRKLVARNGLPVACP